MWNKLIKVYNIFCFFVFYILVACASKVENVYIILYYCFSNVLKKELLERVGKWANILNHVSMYGKTVYETKTQVDNWYDHLYSSTQRERFYERFLVFY